MVGGFGRGNSMGAEGLRAVLDVVEGSSSLTSLDLGYEWMSKELLAGSLTRLALVGKGLGEDGGMVLGRPRLLGRSASTLTYLGLR